MTAAAGAGVRGADQGSTPQVGNFAVSIEAPPEEPLFFWERFDLAFQSQVNDIYIDALNPLNEIQWNLQLPNKDFSNRFHDRATQAAGSGLVDSLDYATREAAIETPFVLWLNARQGWFADLLRNSVDNVGEQSLSPRNVSYSAVEQTWWKSLLQDGGTYYGIRPFSSSPYAYVSHGFIDGGGKTVLLANVRYYYERFSDHRFELSLSVPVVRGFSVDVDSGYQLGTSESNRHVAVQVVKEIKGRGVAHVGFQVQERPMIIAGITFTW